MKKIFNPVVDLRKRLKLNQDEFSRVIGVSSSSVAKWERENGHNDCPSWHFILLSIINDRFKPELEVKNYLHANGPVLTLAALLQLPQPVEPARE